MQTDLQVLRDRITRLESLIGPPPPHPTACIHARTRSALASLRAQVPDEMAAAKRAVELLSHAVPSMRGLTDARRARAAHADGVVDSAVRALQEMQDALQGVQLGDGVLFPEEARQMLADLEVRVAGSAGGEERLDRLLVEFNEATARLNGRILALADGVRGVVEGTGGS